ncbi:HAD family hydrolase [Alkalinema sp. FACHB-956]|uniref:Cof-type HAD-IIB family hydrolase n=1 Tax=Alkalinema sp. FACHB-956 TaxID=2692768 RepID=UPI0032203664
MTILRSQNSRSQADLQDAGQIRLLALDIDGTIAGKSNQLSQPILEAVAAVQAKGIAVAIATGRMYRAALRFHHTLNLRLPLIAYQGAWIQDPITNQRAWHTPVAAPHALNLLDYFEQPDLRQRLSVHFYIDDDLYVRELTPDTEAYVQRSGITPIAVGDLRSVLDRAPTKVLALSADTGLMQTVLADLQGMVNPADLHITTSVATFVEATHPHATKGHALKRLAEEELGLRPEQVMAIGDNCNDLEMIQYAGLGIAMGDAPEIVKATANWIAPTVEADGAAIAIQKFLLS